MEDKMSVEDKEYRKCILKYFPTKKKCEVLKT